MQLTAAAQSTTPLRIFRQVSHKVPRSEPHLELGGARLETAEITRRVALPEAVTLGESNPFSLTLHRRTSNQPPYRLENALLATQHCSRMTYCGLMLQEELVMTITHIRLKMWWSDCDSA